MMAKNGTVLTWSFHFGGLLMRYARSLWDRSLIRVKMSSPPLLFLTLPLPSSSTEGSATWTVNQHFNIPIEMAKWFLNENYKVIYRQLRRLTKKKSWDKLQSIETKKWPFTGTFDAQRSCILISVPAFYEVLSILVRSLRTSQHRDPSLHSHLCIQNNEKHGIMYISYYLKLFWMFFTSIRGKRLIDLGLFRVRTTVKNLKINKK